MCNMMTQKRPNTYLALTFKHDIFVCDVMRRHLIMYSNTNHTISYIEVDLFI